MNLGELTSPQGVPDSPFETSVGRSREFHLHNRLEVSIRTVTSEDEASLLDFLTGLSIGSRRFRFFTTAVDLRAEAHRGAVSADSDHHGVVAVARGRGMVGHAIYVRVPDTDRAEVAVEVVDDLHRLGLATLMLIWLARFAESREIEAFFAEVLPENRDMLTIFRDGFAAKAIVQRDEVDIEFPTSNWHMAQAALKL
jgi:hypothetical protein